MKKGRADRGEERERKLDDDNQGVAQRQQRQTAVAAGNKGNQGNQKVKAHTESSRGVPPVGCLKSCITTNWRDFLTGIFTLNAHVIAFENITKGIN